jgi:SLT domain-containing protein
MQSMTNLFMLIVMDITSTIIQATGNWITENRTEAKTGMMEAVSLLMNQVNMQMYSTVANPSSCTTAAMEAQ